MVRILQEADTQNKEGAAQSKEEKLYAKK